TTMSQEFERSTGIRVVMTQKGSGETLAQMRAEAANPRGDIWWGGTGDPHLQAAEEGLTVEYRSPMEKELAPWALRQAKDAKYRTVGVYAGVLGFGYNTELLKRKNLPEPKCWSDLASDNYKDEVQVADPNSSGTSYTMLATLVQLQGEDKAFDFMKRMHKNINQYTKSGAAPAKAAASGETLIGITFLHDLVTMAVGGAPLKLVAPCEGTGYEVGSMSIIKGGKNPKEARAWYDWALTPEAQAIGAESKAYQIPSNKKAKVPPQAPRLDQTKVIDYDFAKYGSSAERKRLLSKWDKEVKALPK
ncbi:MAG TPA: ABC transporter substrate-binding protein, partial [Burkholderiales bacterium]|nr:ABC transporter substrate-binding protein [Burkholderiales bacterium]